MNQNFRVYFLAVLTALWVILTLASASRGKWPIALICLVMAIANGLSLYRLNRNNP
ncbi:hypothetical protein [Deinococcus aquiradiocola]|uniref:Uncharacterized protein n=1 Tax=Deinococcus aquiradiocola TaxID=393059 RepID=A0A917P6L2_9DEIO|nr:hypothetical protein [Deinococcus aquiradiocola]GGJ64089.1 hypothetical protein GCM10008939_04910 [Deinococcus aquiradiocola]